MLALILLTGCQRDPIFFGYWDIVAVERDGVRQAEAGFLEVLDDGEVALFLRYRWAVDGFEPHPRPRVITGPTDARTQDEIIDGYKEKGETYSIFLGPFDADFDVTSHGGGQAVIVAEDAVWPDTPGGARLETILELAR